jgi:acetyltransferase-like isoleucine patch superfamily enzyme
MEISNIHVGDKVQIEDSTSFNNVIIGNNVKIAKRCSVFGSPKFPLIIGEGTYVGMNTILNGFKAQLKIGERVSIAQNVNIMVDSGPNASLELQKIYPMQEGEIEIGNDSWIGANVIIMPNVKLGKFCVVAANSFVNASFEDYSLIAGAPAKFIKKII